jgi:hypothetical protein
MAVPAADILAAAVENRGEAAHTAPDDLMEEATPAVGRKLAAV